MTRIYIDELRAATQQRIERLRLDLGDASDLAADKACIYATGSFGRLEAGDRSDLDVFIVVDTDESSDGVRNPKLDGIDQIKLKFHLIHVVESQDLPKFDGGGKFLTSHLAPSFTEWLGSSEDDFRNTLTARLLLLLESRCLVGEAVYDSTLKKVTTKYFRDFEGHEANFMPAFMINDILRMWRTFCVNYEFARKGQSREKIKNLKLKFSRMLTCYSAVIYLLSVFARDATVKPSDVQEMVAQTPTERIAVIAKSEFWRGSIPPNLEKHSDKALTLYSEFLKLSHLSQNKMMSEFRKNETEWQAKSYEFGAAITEIIDLIGRTSDHAARLRRLVIT